MNVNYLEGEARMTRRGDAPGGYFSICNICFRKNVSN